MDGDGVQVGRRAAPDRSTIASFGKREVKGLGCLRLQHAKRRSVLGLVAILSAATLLMFDFTAVANSQTVIPKNVMPGQPAVSVPDWSPRVQQDVPLKPSVAPEVEVAPPADPSSTGNDAIATTARVRTDGGHTLFEMALSRAVSAQVFTLVKPYRAVLEVPDLEFRIPAETGRRGEGLITAFRFGLFAAGRSRVVFDLGGPARLVRQRMLRRPEGVLLQLEFEPVSAEAFEVSAPHAHAASEAPIVQAPPVAPHRSGNAKFVVMIDPGHGGVDAGAIGEGQLAEKDVVLAVARHLKAALDAKGRYEVRMTRTADSFVSLDHRVALSEAAAANLFISLHADSTGDPSLIHTAHGATVYTLSENASNQEAKALAEKENAADLAGGLSVAGDAESGQINSILADLMKRETLGFSSEFERLLLARLRPATTLGRDPSRAAAFRVLRQMQTPTVLIELGFITHEVDAANLRSDDWQKRVALSIAAAVDAFAARHAKAAK